MNILVTGGFGFLGSHLVERLLQEGHSVRILDNEKAPSVLDSWIDTLPRNNSIEVIIGDIRDMAVCTKSCSGIDMVFHTAGLASIPLSFKLPQKTYEINVTATENLLKACVGANVKKFIYASSGKVYGNKETLEFKETDPFDPTTPYAQSKVAAERICQRYANISSMGVIVLRYFSIYGPQQRLTGGLVGDVLKSALEKGAHVIHAEQSMERDFSYIDDIVSANILCLDYKPKPFEVFNIASGEKLSCNDLVRILEKIAEKELDLSYQAPLQGTTKSTCADISKAKLLLGYNPEVTLENGLSKTYQWFTEESESQKEKSNKQKVTAVILTGGSGTRIKSHEQPKQFIEIDGKPLFVHCLLTYESIKEIDEICLVVNSSYQKNYEAIINKLNLKKITNIVPGGSFRHESVRNAINSLDKEGLVVIQNGASPLTSIDLIQKCIQKAKVNGAVTAFVPASHTVFIKNNEEVQTVIERSKVGYTCDPQVFETKILSKAIEYSEKLDFNRDIPTIELVNTLGTPVYLVESAQDNLKVTTTGDIKAIEYTLQLRSDADIKEVKNTMQFNETENLNIDEHSSHMNILRDEEIQRLKILNIKNFNE